MKTITQLIKIMFLVFFILQIISFSHLYGNPDFRFSNVDSYLNGIEQKNKSMLTLSMVGGESGIYQRSIGFENIQTGEIVNAKTKYHLGEVSKLFTSIVIMQMVDEKYIQLGTPLSRFYPELPYARRITIEDLLSGNIQVANYLPGGVFYKYYLRGKTFQSTIQPDVMGASPTFQVNESPIDANYLLLGLIIEKIAGKSYHEVITERIIDKLGLMNTVEGSSSEFKQVPAIAYTTRYSGVEPEGVWDIGSLKGTASIYSTPSDMIQLLQSLFGGSLVSEKSLLSMKRTDRCWGLGFTIKNYNGKEAYGYKSNFCGYVNEWLYIPQDTLTIAYSMNLDDDQSEVIMNDILKEYYKNIGS